MPSRSAGKKGGERDPARAAEWLRDILDNIGAIDGFLSGTTRERFLADAQKQYAVNYALICISEAARRLPLPLQGRHRDIPWRQVEDLRNVFTHEYHRLNAALVWDTAHTRLAGLAAAMRAELKRLEKAE